jgi:hypothetical protein
MCGPNFGKDVVTMTCEEYIGCGRRKNINWNQTSFWNRCKKTSQMTLCVIIMHLLLRWTCSNGWIFNGSMDWEHTQQGKTISNGHIVNGSMNWVHKQWGKHLLRKDGAILQPIIINYLSDCTMKIWLGCYLCTNHLHASNLTYKPPSTLPTYLLNIGTTYVPCLLP